MHEDSRYYNDMHLNCFQQKGKVCHAAVCLTFENASWTHAVLSFHLVIYSSATALKQLLRSLMFCISVSKAHEVCK